MLVTVSADGTDFFLGRRVVRATQLDGAHSAESMEVANLRPTLPPGAGASDEGVAQLPRPQAEVFALDHLQNGESRFARYRIAGKGATQAAGAGCIHDVSAAGDGRDGQTSAQRLGSNHNIWLDAVLLTGEERTSARDAGLDFISDEQDAVLPAQCTDFLEVIRGRGQETAFAQHWLSDKCGY